MVQHDAALSLKAIYSRKTLDEEENGNKQDECTV